VLIEVSNMKNSSGNSIPNQFEIHTTEGRYFQSYRSVIAFIPSDGSKIQLGADWEYSVTTGKYRNMFLNESKKDTIRKIKEGVYTLNNNL